MVWHETANPAVIVMLTQVFEAGRPKCHQYFPVDEEHDTITMTDVEPFTDGIPVTLKLADLTFDTASKSTVRKLILTVGSEQKVIWHLLWTKWPDFSVPQGEDREALLELIKLSATKSTVVQNPRIIHCSAGVGRSGTFITLDHLLKEIDSGAITQQQNASADGNADGNDTERDVVFDTVNHLREQRVMMVQSEVQFMFVYEVLREQMEKKIGGMSGAVPTILVGGQPAHGVRGRFAKLARMTTDTDRAASPAPKKASSAPPPESRAKQEEKEEEELRQEKQARTEVDNPQS